MTDDKKDQESGGIEQLLLNLVDKAAGKGGDSKGASFPVYVVLTGVVCLLFALVGFMAVRAKRRAAQLEYDLRKKDEEQKRLAEQLLLEQNDTKRAEAEDQVTKLTDDIQGLKKELEVVGSAAADRSKALAQAASWDDLVLVDKRTP